MIFASTLSTDSVRHLRRGLSWWMAGLRAALPAPFIAALTTGRPIVRLQLDPDDRVLATMLGARRTDAAAVPVEPLGNTTSPQIARLKVAARTCLVVVDCPSAFVLVRRVMVPAAAVEELDGALRYNLSTWTPFSTEDVYVAANLVSTSEDTAVIEVRLVPRSRIQALLDRLEQAGFCPDQLALGADMFANLGLSKKTGISRSGKLDAVLGALAILLVAMIGVTEWWVSGSRLDVLRAAVSQAATELTQQKEIEVAIAKLEQRIHAVTAKMQAQTRVADVLVALSRSLPAEADVQELAWSAKEGRLLVSVPASVDPSNDLAASQLIQVRRLESRGTQRAQTLYEIVLSLRESSAR